MKAKEDGWRRFSEEIPHRRYRASLYGQCMFAERGYDYASLERAMTALGERRLASLVRQDRIALENRPWLLTGGIAESNSRFAVEYGRVSGRVWADFLIEQPLGFFYMYLRATYFYLRGVVFPAVHADATPPRIARLAGYVVAPVLLIGLIASFLVLPWAMSDWIRHTSSFQALQSPQPLIVLSVLLVTTTLSVNLLTCCENGRMFVSVSPIALLIGGTVTDELLRRLVRYRLRG